MKTLHVRSLFFLVPSAIFIGFGLWILVINAVHYQAGVNAINNSKQICDGKHCYCNNVRCGTVDDLYHHYASYFEWSIGFLTAGGIIVIVSRKW